MPWEHRNGRGRYYTRSRRVDGVLTREYVGAGPLAEQIASADDLTRQVLAADRLDRDLRRLEQRNLDRQLDDFCRITDHLVRLALTAAGYHQHARGHWRKARVSTIPSAPTAPTIPTPAAP